MLLYWQSYTLKIYKYEHCNTLVMVMLSNTAVYLEKYGNFCEKWMWNFVAKGADICFTFGYSRYWGFPFIWDPAQFHFVARWYKSAFNQNFVARCYRLASNLNLLPDFNLIRLWACAEQALAGSRDFESAKIPGFLKLKSRDFLSLCCWPIGTILHQKSPKLQNC